MSRLEEARLVGGETEGNTFNHAGADLAYSSAFAEAGLQVESLTVDQLVVRLNVAPTIAMQIAAGLMDWAQSRRLARKQPMEPSTWHFLAVADAIDPDPWREATPRPSETNTWGAGQGDAEARCLGAFVNCHRRRW